MGLFEHAACLDRSLISIFIRLSRELPASHSYPRGSDLPRGGKNPRGNDPPRQTDESSLIFIEHTPPWPWPSRYPVDVWF
jgi:hypothetical protein